MWEENCFMLRKLVLVICNSVVLFCLNFRVFDGMKNPLDGV